MCIKKLISFLSLFALLISASANDTITILKDGNSIQFIALKNNDYFVIERSSNAIIWEQVGTIQGAGNSNTQMDYSFVDSDPIDRLSYYRLTQVDYDGKSKTYNPVSTLCGSNNNGLPIEVYPNPVLNEFTFELDLEEYQGNEVSYTILDAKGAIVASDYIELNRGFNKQKINVVNLPNGVYFLRFNNTRDHIAETRIVKR